MFKVKERRKNLNLTKEEIAKKADILLTTYLAIEKGERLAYPFEAVKIARALNATVEEIFHDDLIPQCDDEFLIIAKRYFAKRRKIRPSDLKLKIIKKEVGTFLEDELYYHFLVCQGNKRDERILDVSTLKSLSLFLISDAVEIQ